MFSVYGCLSWQIHFTLLNFLSLLLPSLIYQLKVATLSKTFLSNFKELNFK